MRHFNTPLLTGALSAVVLDSLQLEALPKGVPALTNDRSPAMGARRRAFTRDQMITYDAQTLDSTGVFLVGELERLDPRLNMPLVDYTWSRDINLRSDVTLADEVVSFTNSTFAAPGGLNPAGKNWIGKNTTQIPGIILDIGKTMNPMNLWGVELSWSIPELVKAQKVGRPIDVQKYDGMMLKWNMDVDEQVYIGDSGLGLPGLFNMTGVTPSNVPNGAGGTPQWSTKTPAEILADVNAILYAAWAATGWSVVPRELRIPPAQFAYLNATMINTLGNTSILTYLLQNNLSLAQGGVALNILPAKWLIGRGVGPSDRMVAYTNEERFVRFPLVSLQRTPLEYRSLYQLTTYYGALGVVESPYTETIAYRDGI